MYMRFTSLSWCGSTACGCLIASIQQTMQCYDARQPMQVYAKKPYTVKLICLLQHAITIPIS